MLLDIEVAGALAPKASIVVYFAPNTDRGFLDAVATAVHATPTPAALSISWGQSEDAWTAQARNALDQAFVDAAALGVTVCVNSRDNGSSDGETNGRLTSTSRRPAHTLLARRHQPSAQCRRHPDR